MSFEKNIEKFSADNVAAIIEGSEFPEEYVVLTAHLDHVLPRNGKIYNGADDNGSGTVAMLEIAESFALAKQMGKGHTICTILCDSGQRYESKIWNKEFLKMNNLPIPEWLI